MYLNKYIKYKLKYLNLKKEQEGAGSIIQAITKKLNRTDLPSMPTIPFYAETRNFDIDQFAVYLDNIEQNPEQKNMYKDIQAKAILTKIKNNYMPYSLDKKIDITIKEVFKNENEKQDKYITYIKDKKKNFEDFQSDLKDTYNPDELNQNILKTCTCHTIIKKDLFYEIKKQLPNFAFINDAIDSAFAKIKFSEKEFPNLKIIKQELLKKFENDKYNKYIRNEKNPSTYSSINNTHKKEGTS